MKNSTVTNPGRARPTPLAAALALALLFGAGPASATLVWNNGSFDSVGGSDLSESAQAEDFSLAATTNLTSLRFWSMELSPAAFLGSIVWEIFSNVAGAVGGSVASGTANSVMRTAAGSAQGYNVFQNDFNLSVGGLAAGTYWLSLHNGSMASTTFNDYYWATGADNVSNRGRELYLPDPQFGWTANVFEHAFQLNGDAVGGDVPEPSSLLLAALAVSLAIGGFAQRRAV